MIDTKTVAKGISLVLKGMGVSETDPNFKGTPQRVARLYSEMLTPYENNWATFPSDSSEMIVLRGHRVFAICPHHLLPVELRCYAAYIPNKLTVGLSKLARVFESQLTKPIMQEQLAHDVAKQLDDRLEPKGVGIVVAGVHGCMRVRGVESDGDVVVSILRGEMIRNQAARSEFLQLIGRP